jgi:hypothetical protein
MNRFTGTLLVLNASELESTTDNANFSILSVGGSVGMECSRIDAEVRCATAFKFANIAAEPAASTAKVEYTEWAVSHRTPTQHAPQSH